MQAPSITFSLISKQSGQHVIRSRLSVPLQTCKDTTQNELSISVACPLRQARLAAEEKRIRFEQQQQGAAASQVEETSFASLLAGQARELIQRQRSAKQSALQYEATKAKASAVRMKAVKQDLKAKADFIKAYDASMQQLRSADQQAKQQDLLRRRGLRDNQHEFESKLAQTHREKAYVRGAASEGPAAALLKQLSSGVLVSEASLKQ